MASCVSPPLSTRFFNTHLETVLVHTLSRHPTPHKRSQQRQHTVFRIMLVSRQFYRIIKTSDLLQGLLYRGAILTTVPGVLLPNHRPLLWLLDRIIRRTSSIQPEVTVITHVLGLIVKLQQENRSRDVLESSLGGEAWDRLDASWRHVKISTSTCNEDHIRLVVEGLPASAASSSRTWFLGHADTLGKVHHLLRKLLAVLGDAREDDVVERLRAMEKRNVFFQS